ncbi:ribonuclease Z [Clostridium magnum]|uniref:Ribonuclease Z n=1 Tax=Clostridium magnum DSM 2767 TaxID=1121326 RepID=A0A161X678_9CLOT|nr:ribonuclease Z [Clostridium magnum]KZL89536.1 ribonuclease Z [Clostridium magnum DSM 2767]SHH71622.1 RNAse Z [Clostridium magnum DSM 2767]
MLDICLLGCGGSMPVPNRSLTSMFASYNGKKVLIDCGEGTQVSLKMLGWGMKSIEGILFTHFHADHIAGLPGLLLTIANSGRIEPLTIIGPEGLWQVVNGLRVIAPVLPYKIDLLELKGQGKASHKIGEFNINIISVEHTIPCLAYSIEVSRSRKFDKDRALENGIPVTYWNRLQKGEEIEHEGRWITPDMVLGDERRGLKVSYCTDTRPIQELKEFVRSSDLFICEGMYGDNESLSKALENRHMLFSEAATLAKEGQVRELWLTHFSPSLSVPEDYLENAKDIFKNTVIGEDRLTKSLNFID